MGGSAGRDLVGPPAGFDVGAEAQAVYVMWLRQMKRFVRARSRLLGNVIQPFIFLAGLGLGFRGARIPGIPAGIDYLTFLAPGIVGMSVMFSSMFAGVSVLWDRQFGFLKEVLVAPVSRGSIVLGRTLGGATVALMQGAIIAAASAAMGASVDPLGTPAAAAFMLALALSAVGFGVAVASKMEDPHGFQLVMNLLVMPLMFLSTTFFPPEGVPEALGVLMRINPLSYPMDGIRWALTGLGYFGPAADAAVSAGLAAAMLALGAWSFGRMEV